MIETMKRIMIACLDKDRQSAVEALGRLGTVHVTPMSAPASEELDSLRKKHDNLLKVVNAFQGLDVQPSAGVNLPPDELIPQALALMEERQHCQEQERAAELAITTLLPWGSFDRSKLDALAERGLHVYPCQASKTKLLELLEVPGTEAAHAYPLKQTKELPQKTVCQILSKTKDVVRFAVISREALDESRLPLAQLPAQTDLKQLNRDLNNQRQRQAELVIQLRKLAARSGALEDYRLKLDSQIEFTSARDSMATSNRLAFLKGYVPETKLDAVRMAARTNGWAIRHEDVPEDDGDVPVHLLIPRPFRMAQAIFDFVGILPGYHEVDVSISMLVFLSVFCAMLIGDAGYGLIFTLITLGMRLHCRDEKKADGLNVLLLMSVCTFVYGALSGSWFAIETTRLPSWLQGWRWLNGVCERIPGMNDAAYSLACKQAKDAASKHVQIICFFLAGTQMSLARVWRACRRLLKSDESLPQSGFRATYAKVREILGHLGWGIFLWGNYGLAKLLVVDNQPVTKLGGVYCVLFAVGFVLILLFSIDWTSVVTVIYMPFSFINTFVDTLSYIRLFAVGVSSYYIANAFNDMGSGLFSKGTIGVVCGLLVLLLGHILNICLALMGVLVHGIRLNALEFSGHMDISWSGQPYHPLQSCENSK